MADSQRRRNTSEKPQLTRDAWLDAAAGAVMEGGFDNVRVLVLAKKLGVTRGSFYWHFRDHQDLIVSFLERWRDRRLAELAYWRPSEGDIPAELQRKMHLLLSEASGSTRRMKVELAVRDLARRDEMAARMVKEVDQARIAQNESLLARLEVPPSQCRDLALMLYVTTVGAQLVLTGPGGDTASVERIEQLIARMITEWPEGPGSSTPGA